MRPKRFIKQRTTKDKILMFNKDEWYYPFGMPDEDASAETYTCTEYVTDKEGDDSKKEE